MLPAVGTRWTFKNFAGESLVGCIFLITCTRNGRIYGVIADPSMAKKHFLTAYSEYLLANDSYAFNKSLTPADPDEGATNV